MIMEKIFYDIQVVDNILVSLSIAKIIIKLITVKGMLANADQFRQERIKGDREGILRTHPIP